MTTTEESETDPVPDYLRHLEEDWFGEAAAPLLFRAVNLESWDTCHRLLERDTDVIREEFKHVDMYGYSAMHYACWWNSARLDVVRRIIDLSPQGYASRPNRKGRTPLHLAAWRGRDEVVELLADRCPEAAMVTDRTHKTPLVDACYRNRSKRVLKALLKADSSQIIKKNNHERTAALIFFRISHGYVSAPHRTRFYSAEEQELYGGKVRVVLSAEREMQSENSLDLDDAWNLLRAAIESPSCPFPYVKHLLAKLETKIPSFCDENGFTLLHIAAQAKPFAFKSFFKCDRCNRDASACDSTQKMYFNRDPDKPHWGVRCSNPLCRRFQRPLMIQYVLVPVGKL
jgi:hypothetical protein